ncbi:hypothetical protein HPP92_028515 [Vanilla planifolia]|uniref:Uncharacterized protein n=1 Tax=Vanilla planifolia TaxID=51239 RepID=A0A835U421_VANPL|nr:hypothetical protein HPP92_028515 [Vanilla planifolia]
MMKLDLGRIRGGASPYLQPLQIVPYISSFKESGPVRHRPGGLKDLNDLTCFLHMTPYHPRHLNFLISLSSPSIQKFDPPASFRSNLTQPIILLVNKKKVLRAYPSCPGAARLGIGYCRYKLGQFDKARQPFHRVLDAFFDVSHQPFFGSELIEMAHIRSKLSKQERVALIRAGRGDREKYKAKTIVKQKRQKQHSKAMPLATKRARAAHSRQEKKKRQRQGGKQFRGRKAWK